VQDLIRISLVSYLNSKPFIYGLRSYKGQEHISIEPDIPSECARKLAEGKVDVGLVPVAVIPELKEHYIISDYCIGSDGPVDTVMLYSQVPLEEIEKIYLDYQSRTSVMLAQVLAKYFWKIQPEWVAGYKGFETQVKKANAAVIIGDRAFDMNGKYAFEYDLSEQWKHFTGLPFVFACWISNKKLPDSFISSFNEALAIGITNIESVIEEYSSKIPSCPDLSDYFYKKISYKLDKLKKESLEHFLNLSIQD
jgi:chorismate dehydratase